MTAFKALLFDMYDTLIWLDTTLSNRYRQRFANRIGVPLEQFLDHWRGSVGYRMLGKGNGLADHLTTALSEMGIEPEPTLIAASLPSNGSVWSGASIPIRTRSPYCSDCRRRATASGC